MAIDLSILPPRWYPLRQVEAQMGYVRSPHRFNLVPAGRRSGKTERAKRKVVRRALTREGIKHSENARFFLGAPTRDQAKAIFWDDIKELTRPWWIREPQETELIVQLVTGSIIQVLGLDKPERIEGRPWDGGILDEYGNMKEKVWPFHVRPALSTPGREGWCDLIGVPEGRNHYYTLCKAAQAEMLAKGAASEFGYYHWLSSAVLSPSEIESARNNLDPLSFQQEYEASFVNFSGRAYYAFTDDNLAPMRQKYNPKQPLIICLDFNVAPGVAVICQELPAPRTHDIVTAIIGEVYIPSNSNTVAVCRKILKDWGEHKGYVEVFGDATGGSDGSAKVLGSDWDLVKKTFREGAPGVTAFGDNFTLRVKTHNPSERARVNAVNTRCLNAKEEMHLLADPSAAPYTVRDLEGVIMLEGGSGEIDKKKDPKLTHSSDALGYYIESRFPVSDLGKWGSSNFKIGG